MEDLSIYVVFVGLKNTILIDPLGYFCSYYSIQEFHKYRGSANST